MQQFCWDNVSVILEIIQKQSGNPLNDYEKVTLEQSKIITLLDVSIITKNLNTKEE